ncbi:MAG: hypothetical protein WAO76_13185 [Georgfuchsia sp.]
MTIDNQIEIPQSFMAMYVTPGHDCPNAAQEVVVARYEFCEDVACLVAEQAQTLADKENISECEVLARCHQGLLAKASTLTEQESTWVMYRLAELLQWTPLVNGAN